MIVAALLCILCSFILYGLSLLNKLRNFFKDRNVKHIKPIILVGNSLDSVLGKAHNCEVLDRLYRAFPEEEVVGHLELIKPQFVVRTPELVETVLVKEFSHFHDRFSSGSSELRYPEDANMFILQGNVWRAIRNRFSPLFTSGKLKVMYNSIAGCGKNLESVLNNKIDQEVEMTDILSLFAMDVIGSTAFGLEPNLLHNPDSKFRKMGLQFFSGSLQQNIKVIFVSLFPKLARMLDIRGFASKKVNDYFLSVIFNAIERRKKDGTERNDFLQMLLQLREKGKVEIQINDSGDDYLMLDKISDTFELEMSDTILVGAAFTFLTAGFHATAMTLAYALFELAQSLKVTKKLREEIQQTVKGDVPTYEELKNMPYLEMVIKEVMRLHPTAPALTRRCTKEYTFKNGVVIKPGEEVIIPARSIHRDPEHWPDPHRFDPERFQTPPKPGTYLAFGDGPRICIAMRFALLEMKFAIVALLAKYDFEISMKNKFPLKLHPRMFLATPYGGIKFFVKKRSTTRIIASS